MSGSSHTVEIFRNVNGDRVELEIKNERENKVTTFVVHKNSSLNVTWELIKCCLFLVTCFFVNNVTVILIFGVALVWQYVNFSTAVTTDTLIVIESIGVQIAGKSRFLNFETTEFLPWNIIQDVFINEVITERRVLYYLTFIVENGHEEKTSVRLVPLFRQIKPEKKCLEYIYNQLAVFIKPDKKS